MALASACYSTAGNVCSWELGRAGMRFGFRSNTLCDRRALWKCLEGGFSTRNIGLHGVVVIVKRKNASTLVAVGILLTAFSHNAGAQQNTESCTLYNQLVERYGFSCLYNWTFDDLPDPMRRHDGVLQSTWRAVGQVCAAPRPSCGAPPGAASQTCLSCNQGKTPRCPSRLILARETPT